MTVLPDLSHLAGLATQRGGDPNLLRDELVHIIRNHAEQAPRSLQKKIGPSEIGTPCNRRLGHMLAGTERRASGDPWRTTVGTAVHQWLAEAMAAANASCPPGEARWLVEQRVVAGSIDGTTLDGTTDLYDRVTATVLDWKTTTLPKIRAYKANGPDEQYRVQAMVYGMGWTQRGLPVDTVAIFFLPRDGQLADAYMHHEPYDENVALAAIAKADAIARAGRLAGWNAVLPGLATTDAHCLFCPFLRQGTTDLTTGCPGHGDIAAPKTLTGLLAG